ncbi:ABC transporter permease [Yinghuangia seranimata]|uniref:ABC transporter permease n=1 Tax=Yinghuangia seranimata TaxID=408067 RepID=UPI00248AA2CD|nr:ABC transporter permease [Yinghuangia seranimata]MDI2131909.1 ABC transporter permease [Yinghuangia seranimata]
MTHPTITVAASLLPVTPTLGVVIAVLLLAAFLVAALAHLGHGREVLVAGVRAAVQLLVVALVIGQVVHHWWATLLFVLVMYGVAAATASGRITGVPWRPWAAVPLLAGTLPVLTLLMVTRLVPFDGLVLIPVAGILIGGAMTATVLAGRRALEELTVRRGEVEAALSLGLMDREARLEICRPVAAGALIPALDQTRTVGLVTLPGAFVGMLLGGASPAAAGAVQLFVLIGLLATESIAIAVLLELVGRGQITRSAANSR